MAESTHRRCQLAERAASDQDQCDHLRGPIAGDVLLRLGQGMRGAKEQRHARDVTELGPPRPGTSFRRGMIRRARALILGSLAALAPVASALAATPSSVASLSSTGDAEWAMPSKDYAATRY